MAHVLNKPERNQAFWKFVFFYLLSTVLIVGAVYFDGRVVPKKENDIMRDQIVRYQTQARAQEKFVKSMDDAKQLIDSLTKPGANIEYLNLLVLAKIRELSELQYKDSSMYSRLNKNVLDVFLNYHAATKKNINMGDMPQQLANIKAQNEQCQRDLQSAQATLKLLQNTAP